MRSLFRSLKFAWEYWVRKQHRRPSLPDFNYPAVDAKLMKFLVGMYEGHGAPAIRADNWVMVDTGALLTRACCYNLRQHPGTLILQVDFVTLACPSGHHIIESFAGIGADKGLAIQDACKGFQDCSFHPLFAALLGRECSHCEVESWTIGGLKRRVTMGLLRTRGHFQHENWPGHFAEIQKILESHALPSGLHWIRVFYCHSPSAEPTTEVLVDNDIEEALQAAVGRLDWPKAAEFYSVRLFMVIQDG